MALSNFAAWNDKAEKEEKTAASCGTACGAGDEEKPSSACGAGE